MADSRIAILRSPSAISALYGILATFGAWKSLEALFES
jgi:hypothetical protein